MSHEWVVVFFFQAEDGIRDIGVTGVQTCALPISGAQRAAGGGERRAAATTPAARRSPPPAARCAPASRARPVTSAAWRSEERRVGKEGRCPGAWEPREKQQIEIE